MNPSTTATHAYATDLDAHRGFLDHMRARRIECAARSEESMTKAEKFYWSKYEQYLAVVEKSVCSSSGGKLTRENTSKSRAMLKMNVEKQLVGLLDKARTTTEKETLQGCLDALEEGLRMHASHTGIY